MTVALREKEIACGTVEKPRIAQEAPTDSTGEAFCLIVLSGKRFANLLRYTPGAALV